MSENSQAFQNEQTPEKLCVDLIEYIIHSIIEAEEISSRPAGSISSHSTHPISTHHASLEDNLIDSVDLIHQRNPIARANVEQWRCYQQANNHSCGYYALHNILTSLEWFHHKGLTTSSAPLHQLIRNGALFLKSFHRIQAQIRAIAQKKDTGFYPWREKDISSGLLEREYARMLFINPKDEIIFRWKHNITVVSSFGLNEMMNGALFHTQVHSLDATFLKFRSPPSHIEDRGYMHGFLIGLTCHWISLLCIREPNKEDIKVLVFDSRNRPVLSKSVHEIEEILKNHAPPNMDPWRHLVRRNSYVDILLATSIIARCAMGEYRFMTLYNHFLIVGLVKNFVSSIPSSFMEDHNAAINTEMQSDAFRICDASSFSRMASCFMAAFWQLQESPVIHQLIIGWMKREAPLSTLFSCTIVPINESGYQWTHPTDNAIVGSFTKILQSASSMHPLKQVDHESSLSEDLMTVVELLRELVRNTAPTQSAAGFLGPTRCS